MTPLSAYEVWLLEMWYEVGTVGQSANGLIPLAWSEITSWATQFHTETYTEWVEHPRPDKRYKLNYTPILVSQCMLLEHELQWIHKLSCEYVSEYSAASDASRECPKKVFIEDVSEDQAKQNAHAMASALKEMFGVAKE